LPVAALAGAVLSASAQTPSAPPRYEIGRLAFEGNAALTANELQAQMTTRETPGFLNRFLHNSISEKLGRKNEYLSLPTLATDLRRLHTYYENRGFFGAAVDTQLTYRRDDGEVDVTIRIREGYRALIDTLNYLGIVNAPGTIWTDIQAAPRIAVGDPYNAQLLEEEVVRVLEILANTGYPNARYLPGRCGTRAPATAACGSGSTWGRCTTSAA